MVAASHHIDDCFLLVCGVHSLHGGKDMMLFSYPRPKALYAIRSVVIESYSNKNRSKYCMHSVI